MNRFTALVSACLVAVVLTGCGNTPAAIDGPFQNEPVFGNLSARSPRAVAPASAQGLVPIDTGVGITQTFGETAGVQQGAEANSASGSPQTLDGAATYRLNFDNAELAQVVRSILSDALQVNYTVNADLSGRVTISSERPVRRDELLSILENLLAGDGLALAASGSGYRIEPSSEAVGRTDRGGASSGYGVSVVPLRFVSVETMSTILESFVVPAENLRVSVADNAVIVRGPGEKRRETVAAIMSFDADWMRDQTVSIFELRRATPQAVASELDTVFSSGEEGAAAGAIEFKALPRLKAVMALSKSSTLMRRAAVWVRRLDVANTAAEENVFVYRARYRNATELARIVGTLFDTNADTSRPGVVGAVSPGTFAGPDAPEASGFAASTSGGDEDRFSEAASLFPGTDAAPAAVPEAIDLATPTNRDGSGVRLSADVANNAVVVYADGETYQKILATLKALDATPVQVAINVTIAEIRLTDQLEFGVQYFVKSGSVGLDDDNGSVSLFSEVANTLQKQLPGFNFVVGSDSDPDVIISALDAITDVEILSSPSLVVVENETATLQVGDSVPVTVRQAQSVEDLNAPLVNQVEFRDTGIILNVTPRIGENDAVTMKVAQEVSAVSGDPSSLTPTFTRRRVTSAISVQSGQTVLLAGLIQARRRSGEQGIPVVKNVPLVGKLFSQTTKDSDRTELVVLIRPVVIRNGQDARSVAEELRTRMPIIGSRDAPQGVLKQ